MPLPYPRGTRYKLIRSMKAHKCALCGEVIEKRLHYIRATLTHFGYAGRWQGTEINDPLHLTCFEQLDRGYADFQTGLEPELGVNDAEHSIR